MREDKGEMMGIIMILYQIAVIISPNTSDNGSMWPNPANINQPTNKSSPDKKIKEK
jgi:hypothetical protein